MKQLLYIICALACEVLLLVSCSSELDERIAAFGTLELSLTRGPLPHVAQRSVAEGLAVQLLRPDGTIYREYAAGAVPDKIQLEADVVYALRAYSDNQSSWSAANDGKGEACYYGETTVSVGEDATAYVTYAVPMVNYAVTLTLPALFGDLFKSYTFAVSSGERAVTLQEGEKAYFALPEGFSYQLSATNTDDVTNSHSVNHYSDVEAGNRYNVRYQYGLGSGTGAINIEITYDDSFDVVPEEIIIGE